MDIENINKENVPASNLSQKEQIVKTPTALRDFSSFALKPVNDESRLVLNSSPSKGTPLSSPYKPIRQLDSAERWIERTSVVTKQDHKINLENSSAILADVVSRLPLDNYCNEWISRALQECENDKNSTNLSVPKTEVDELSDLLGGLDLDVETSLLKDSPVKSERVLSGSTLTIHDDSTEALLNVGAVVNNIIGKAIESVDALSSADDKRMDFLGDNKEADFESVEKTNHFQAVDKVANLQTLQNMNDLPADDKITDFLADEKETNLQTGHTEADFQAGDQVTDFQADDKVTDVQVFSKMTDLQAIDNVTDFQASNKIAVAQNDDKLTDFQASNNATDFQLGDNLTDLHAFEEQTNLQVMDKETDFQAGNKAKDLQGDDKVIDSQASNKTTYFRTEDKETNSEAINKETDFQVGPKATDIHTSEISNVHTDDKTANFQATDRTNLYAGHETTDFQAGNININAHADNKATDILACNKVTGVQTADKTTEYQANQTGINAKNSLIDDKADIFKSDEIANDFLTGAFNDNKEEFAAGEFRPAAQVFDDPAFFDMLEKADSSKVADPKRGSVLLKFDPLQARRESALPKSLNHDSFQRSILQDSKNVSPSDNSVCLFGTPPKVSRRRMSYTNRQKARPNYVPSIEEETQANEVDMIFAKDNIDGIDTILQENLFPVAPNAQLVDVCEAPTYTEVQMKEMKTRLTMELQELMLKKDNDFQKRLKEKDAEIEELSSEAQKEVEETKREAEEEKAKSLKESEMLRKKIKSLEKKLSEISDVVKEYTTLITTVNEGKETAETELLQSQKSYKQVLEDNKMWEKSFDDLYRRYEKLKEAMENASQNQKVLEKTLAEEQNKRKANLEASTKMKEVAEAKISELEEKLEKSTSLNKEEMAKLDAALKRKAIQIQGLESALEQKKSENKELTELCDTLINKAS